MKKNKLGAFGMKNGETRVTVRSHGTLKMTRVFKSVIASKTKSEYDVRAGVISTNMKE